MDYKAVASALAKLGMNGDTELIHVNSSELAQIQKHFGRLPNINPHTGLKSFDDGGDGGGSSDSGSDPGSGGDSPSEHGGGPGGSDSANNHDNSNGGDSPSEHGNGPGDSNFGGTDNSGQGSGQDFGNIADPNPADFSVDMSHYQDFTENFNMPNTDLFSKGLASLTGIQLGHNALGDLGVSVDFNVGSLAGLVGGPIGGMLGKTIADLAGVPHVGFTLNEKGLTFNADQPDPLNDTKLASAIARGANDLGFTTGVASMDQTKTGSFVDLGKAGVSSDSVASNTPGVSDSSSESVNPNQQIADLTSENQALTQQLASAASANHASATAFSNATLGGFNGSNSGSTIAPFDFNNMDLFLPGNMTKDEIQHNKDAENKKKMFRLGDFIQNVANTALAAPAKPFASGTPYISPTSFISPTQFS